MITKTIIMAQQKSELENELKKLQIWTIIGAIPHGQVACYGQIAKMAGLPNYARFVGACLKNLPKDSQLPWHRVINAQGCISFSAHSADFCRQKERLEAEGILITNGRVSLKKYQWHASSITTI